MTFGFYTNIVSPHQLPLARELVARLGADNYRYIHDEPFYAERAGMGWREENEPWIVDKSKNGKAAQQWLEDCDVLVLDHRDLDLVERRAQKGRKTFYTSERWFKPIGLRNGMSLPGGLRMFVPGYRRMAKRFVALARQYSCFRILPYGVHARADFKRLGVPEDKMDVWGYFVEPGLAAREARDERAEGQPSTTKVLWVGRLLRLKRVDTIVRAVDLANGRLVAQGSEETIELTVVGNGEDETRIRGLVAAARHPSRIVLRSAVPLQAVRQLMREHDVYVLASDANEGWGAVVSEALEEGMCVLGTHEAGACATLLPSDHLFASGDAETLAARLTEWRKLSPNSIGDWTAASGAERLLALCGRM